MKPQDIADLKQLIEFLKEHQVAEFDLDRGDLKIRLKFTQAASAAGLGDLARLLASAPVTAAPAPSAAAPAAVAGRRLRLRPTPMRACTWSNRRLWAPFTARPRPAQRRLLSPGDHVDKGQVICIVEAMKLMNEIESDAAGEIVKCFVSNGQPIEFGQPLFSIRRVGMSGANARKRGAAELSHASTLQVLCPRRLKPSFFSWI